jgi:hypothetical protein
LSVSEQKNRKKKKKKNLETRFSFSHFLSVFPFRIWKSQSDLFASPAPPTPVANPAIAATATQTQSFNAFLTDLALESHTNALSEAGFTSIASLAALNPESAADLARLPTSIPFLSKKKMLYRAAIDAPTPPPPPSASSLMGLRSGSSATLRPLGSRPPPPPVSELTNPRKPKPPPPALDVTPVNDRLALLSHPPPPLPPSPATLRRVTTGDAADHAPQPPPAALKKDMLKKLKPIGAQSAEDLSDLARPPTEMTRSKSGLVPTVSRTLSPPPPAATNDELATSPRRHHGHHHPSSPSKKREKSSKDKSSATSSRANALRKSPRDDDERPLSTSPPPPPVVAAPAAPAAPSDVETDEYKAMLKASKKAKLARIFGARPASNVIDAEVAALATRQLGSNNGDEQWIEDDGNVAAPSPPPKSTSPAPTPLDDDARHALLAKQRKKSKLEKVFGVRPASFLLTNDGKADELPALLRNADTTASTADDDSSDTLSDDFDAVADEKRRATSRVTLQIQVPEHQMYKKMDFPADWTVAEALVAIRGKIPALSEQDAFVMTRVVDSTDVPLRTTQSMRVFSLTEANVVKLCSMSRDGDANSTAAVPEGPRHWDRASGATPSQPALSSSGRMLSLLRKSTTSTSTTPSPADAANQPPKMMAVMLDADLNARFDLFLRHRHAEESLRCWGDIQDYKQLTSQMTRVAMAKAIYDKYIRRDAIDEVNLNDIVRREVRARRRIAAVDLFETTEDALVNLMRERYLEFLKSIGF